MSLMYFGVEFPDWATNPKFVETVSGCFTLQINNDKLTEEQIKNWDKEGRPLLAQLTKQVLERFTTIPVKLYHS